jgi:hypothetical protein
MTRLASWGFSSSVLQRLGGFSVAWGLFENQLEAALWALTKENVKGVRPSTDKVPISGQIKLLVKHSNVLSPAAQRVVSKAGAAATDLMEYRHSITHGALIPAAIGGPSFIRNPGWHGEKRARPTHDAQVDENLLDLAIDTTWVLCEVVFSIKSAVVESAAMKSLESLARAVARAESQANELRHLVDLMNSEKY